MVLADSKLLGESLQCTSSAIDTRAARELVDLDLLRSNAPVALVERGMNNDQQGRIGEQRAEMRHDETGVARGFALPFVLFFLAQITTKPTKASTDCRIPHV